MRRDLDNDVFQSPRTIRPDPCCARFLCLIALPSFLARHRSKARTLPVKNKQLLLIGSSSLRHRCSPNRGTINKPFLPVHVPRLFRLTCHSATFGIDTNCFQDQKPPLYSSSHGQPRTSTGASTKLTIMVCPITSSTTWSDLRSVSIARTG